MKNYVSIIVGTAKYDLECVVFPETFPEKQNFCWIAELNDYDIVAQGNSPVEALRHLEEAVLGNFSIFLKQYRQKNENKDM